MNIDLDTLEKTALEAGYWGQWAIWEDLTSDGFVHVGNTDGVIPEGEIATPEEAEANPIANCYTREIAEHIAAFTPETALALIAEIRELRAERDQYKESDETLWEAYGAVKTQLADLVAERDTLQAEVQTLRQANAETDRGREEIKTRARNAIAERDALQAKLDAVRELAELDRRCPCCTGYESILDALGGDAE